MSQDVSGNPLEPEPGKNKRGCGCGTVLLVFVGLILVGWLSVNLYMSYVDRAAMRENLRLMGVGKWEDCPSKVDVWHTFVGSEAHFYRLSIPPQEVDQFLAALQSKGSFEQGQPTITHGDFPHPENVNESWWRPQDEKELLLIEQLGGHAGHRYPVWYVAAAKDTGHVYMYRVGF